MYTKVAAICKLGTDIIFLSDVRLGNKSKEVSKLFNQQYKSIFHSSISRRGVGILFRNDLDIEIMDSFRDTDENILIIKCNLAGERLILGSVYGPNTDDGHLFFDAIDRYLATWPGVPVILQ